MSKPEWIADIDIDAELAQKVIAAQFPELAGTTVELFGSGFDNAAFLVDERIIFRFPRRRIVIPLLEREMAVLPHLASQLPIPISTPTYLGVSSDAYPWPFAGYDYIKGTTACSVSLDADDRRNLSKPLARFLRALHNIDPTQSVAAGLPPDELGRLDYDRRMNMVYERRPVLEEAGFASDMQRIIPWLESHRPVAISDSERRVVHGDLYARHIVLGNNRLPVGIIDWGDMHFGDPALDLMIAHLMLPPDLHAEFLAYGPVDARMWHAAKWRAAYHAMLVLDYGIRAEDSAMRQIGATALTFIRSS